MAVGAEGHGVIHRRIAAAGGRPGEREVNGLLDQVGGLGRTGDSVDRAAGVFGGSGADESGFDAGESLGKILLIIGALGRAGDRQGGDLAAADRDGHSGFVGLAVLIEAAAARGGIDAVRNRSAA